MKRRGFRAVQILACILFTGLPQHSWGAPRVSVTAVRPGYRGPLTRISPAIRNPALIGGVLPSLANPKIPFLRNGIPTVSDAQVALPLPLSALPGFAINGIVIDHSNGQIVGQPLPMVNIGETVLSAAQGLSDALGPKDGKERSTSEVGGTFNRFFDRSIQMGSKDGVDGNGANQSGKNASSKKDIPLLATENGGGNGDGIDDPDTADGAMDGIPTKRLYPRVMFLQDVFTEPPSDQTVAYLEKIVEAGVHLVFMTWRPHKVPSTEAKVQLDEEGKKLPVVGKDSAEEILLSRMKGRLANPIIVASYNGGKVSLHGRAKQPKSIAEDVGAFTPEHIAQFEAMTRKVEKTLKVTEGTVTEMTMPDKESAFTYLVELPEDQVPFAKLAKERAKALRRYNTLLRSAKLNYRMEVHPTNPRQLIMQSMPMRFSLNRIYTALNELFPEDKFLDENGKIREQEKLLILADSRKSPLFSTSFPKQAQIQVARGNSAVEATLAAVLGESGLPAVSLKLGKLRQYVEYWEPGRRWLAGDKSQRAGGGGTPRSTGDRETNKMLAMYSGSVLYQFMAWYYEQVWRGQHKTTTQFAALERLKSMWYNPVKYRVFVNKPLAKIMASPAWKAVHRGYLEYAQAYFMNYYGRDFGRDYSAAARDVQVNMVGLATDRKSLITLEFASEATGKLYKIHTRIPRVMKLDTAEGRTLTAHAYRTGKEVAGDGEKVFARILAMALLKGHARRGEDGKWHHGSPEGPEIAKLKVQLEYRSSARSYTFDPEDFLQLEDGQVAQGPIVQEITSTIERMEADDEYQEYYRENEQQASKEDLKKKRKTTKKPTAKKPTRKTTTKASTKTTRKTPRRTSGRGR